MQKDYDCIVVGSGPAGCSAAVYLGMSGLTSCVLTGPTPGGLLTKTHRVDNYLGMYGYGGMDITEQFINHASKFTNLISDVAENIEPYEHYVNVTTNNNILKSKYVIIACGSTPKKLNVPNESATGVSYCAVCDGFFYKNMDVCVIGGGNSAFEEAIYMSKIANKVTLLHRSDSFRAFKSNVDKAHSIPNIEIITNVTVQKFNVCNDQLESVTIENKQNKSNNIKVQGAFIAIGYGTCLDFVQSVDKIHGYIKVDNGYCSSHPRIFGCGDCIVNNNLVRYKQASISAAEGCVCALEIARLLS